MRRVPAALIAPLLAAGGFGAAAAAAPAAAALEHGEFGWRTGEVTGRRPLRVIWVHEPDNSPPAELARYERYFADTKFGRELPPAERPRYEPTVTGYFHEVSGGRFTFTRAGFIRALNLSIKGKEPGEVARLALEAAANDGKFDFKALDRSHDDLITPSLRCCSSSTRRQAGIGSASTRISQATGLSSGTSCSMPPTGRSRCRPIGRNAKARRCRSKPCSLVARRTGSSAVPSSMGLPTDRSRSNG